MSICLSKVLPMPEISLIMSMSQETLCHDAMRHFQSPLEKHGRRPMVNTVAAGPLPDLRRITR